MPLLLSSDPQQRGVKAARLTPHISQGILRARTHRARHFTHREASLEFREVRIRLLIRLLLSHPKIRKEKWEKFQTEGIIRWCCRFNTGSERRSGSYIYRL